MSKFLANVRKSFPRVSLGRVVYCERLESRTLLTTFTVTNVNDSGKGSLREDIMLADAAASASNHPTIKFDIPVAKGTVAIIAPKSALPTVANDITIDGSTEPSSVSGVPHVAIVGINAGSTSGLKVSAADTINGLSIADFKNNGIVVSGGFLQSRGVDVTTGSGSTTISNNAILANGNDGLLIQSKNNTISDNRIGTDVTGKLAAGNKNCGIEVTGTGNTISGNLVSGNDSNGINLDPTANHTVVVKNFIGTNAAGTAAIPNGTNPQKTHDLAGLFVQSSDNTVGKLGQGNLISGNKQDGIDVWRDDNEDQFVVDNVIQGNTIGTTLSGETALPNATGGIGLSAVHTTIDSNLISGNGGNGIDDGDGAGDVITSNTIGADRKRSAPLGNKGDGIFCGDASVTIGKVGSGNYICSNTQDGVEIQDSEGTPVIGNSIGVGAKGVLLGNGGFGVDANTESANVSILTNSIYANKGGGIHPGEVNEAGDLPVVPVLSIAGPTGIKGAVYEKAQLKISVRYPIIKYTVQFFSSPKLGAGGKAQGETYLGQITVTTTNLGVASFTANFAVKADQIISATATDPNGNTSAFSNGVTAT